MNTLERTDNKTREYYKNNDFYKYIGRSIDDLKESLRLTRMMILAHKEHMKALKAARKEIEELVNDLNILIKNDSNIN